MFLVFAVRVETSSTLSLDFKGSWPAGAGGEDPCIVLGEQGDSRMLHVYKLHEDGHHVEAWSRHLPQHVSARCRKAVTAAGDVLLQEDEDSTTWLVNRDDVLDSWQQEGLLIGCLSPRRAVYQRLRRKERDWQLLIREEDGSVLAAEQTWRHWHLSVCGDQDKIAVTDYSDRTLSILSTQGNSHKHTIHFTPQLSPITAGI